MEELWKRLRRTWALLRTGAGAGRNPRKLTISEVVTLLESEVSRGITDGSRTGEDGTVVRVTSVDVEVPLGITTDPNADRGIEMDLGSGVTTTTNVEAEPGGHDGSLRVRFTPGPGVTSTRTLTEADRPETQSGTHSRTQSGTPIESIRTIVGEPVDDLLEAGIHTVEDVADAGESTIAEVTALPETEARRLVSFASAVRLGASRDTARVLAALGHTTDDLAGMAPTALVDDIESALEDGSADVHDGYRIDLEELAGVVQKAERLVAEEE